MLRRTPLRSSLALLLVPALASAQERPPGLILVEGGRTKIGSKVQEIEPLIEAHRQFAATLAGETPQMTVEVEDFYLMPTEVTNEQYVEYVDATRAKPPYYWGDQEAIDKARAEFVQEMGRLSQEAREEGKPFEREMWDTAKWWEENWQDQDWSVPTDRLDEPVNFVTYYDAEAYAKWAGLRLMTQEEFHRACRGDGDALYPWGDEWDEKACNSLDFAERSGVMPVGSFEKGARNGIHDLIGNVFEWTASRYRAYEDYEPLQVKVKRGEIIDAMADFDSQERVVVGGAFTVTGFACRVTARHGQERRQSAEGLGFRCAADVTPGVTAATNLLDDEVRRNVLPYAIDFDPEHPLVLQRWESRPGEAQVEGYAVIERYERALFVPVSEKQLAFSSPNDMSSWTDKNGPAFVGVVSLPFSVMEPLMDGGTYFVAWRGEGRLRLPEEEEEEEETEKPKGPEWWKARDFDPEVSSFLLYDLEGEPVVALPSGPVEFDRPEGPGRVTVEPWVEPEEIDEENPPTPMDTVRFALVIPAKNRKAFHADLVFRIAPDTWKPAEKEKEEEVD